MIRKGGFTLIEILLVVVLLRIVTVIAVPHISRARVETGTTALAADLIDMTRQSEPVLRRPWNGPFKVAGISELTLRPSRLAD